MKYNIKLDPIIHVLHSKGSLKTSATLLLVFLLLIYIINEEKYALSG